MVKPATIGAVVALIALVGGTTPGWAAGDETTVRIALLDMTSNAGMGPAGQAMMAPGMGSGTTGSGTMGNNPMFPMGVMSIRTDQSTVKAGHVKF